MGTILKGGTVFVDGGFREDADVVSEGGVITNVGSGLSCVDADVIDCSGCYVLPGLTDIHLHGGAGHDFCDGDFEALDAISVFEYSQGVTSFCPATMTLPEDRLTSILKNAAEYRKRHSSDGGSELVGIHLEGPFISKEKCGAQKPEYIQKPSAEKLMAWQVAADGLISLVTIAPETDGALGLIAELSGKFHFSVGHTDCGYETAAKAFEAGADHVTHLFNAMPPFHHRDTGVIGSAFDDGRCFAELICDGIHLSQTAVKAAFRLFGGDRIVLISDSMEAVGMPDGEYTLGGHRVIKHGRKAVLGDGTLAGSASSLYDCLKKAVEFGIPLESAVKAATINPCRSIGIDGSYGSIEVGKKARFLLLDKGDLSIRRVI